MELGDEKMCQQRPPESGIIPARECDQRDLHREVDPVIFHGNGGTVPPRAYYTDKSGVVLSRMEFVDINRNK